MSGSELRIKSWLTDSTDFEDCIVCCGEVKMSRRGDGGASDEKSKNGAVFLNAATAVMLQSSETALIKRIVKVQFLSRIKLSGG